VIEGSLSSLNSRELEIIGLISKGLSNSEVAGKLNLSPETIKWYNKIIFSKLGVSSRTEAAAMVKEDGVIDAQPNFGIEQNQRTSNNLPAPVNSFVGRATEIVEIENLLSTARLVVLTGPGGSGKTRNHPNW
jgi:ATP/maltotriose-dependent transcriptional regulator MalT